MCGGNNDWSSEHPSQHTNSRKKPRHIMERFLLEDDGASALEYGLLAALIAATVVGSASALSVTVETMYVTAMGTIVAAMGS